MHYDLYLKTPPATEPLTLAQVKEFLKISDYADTSAGLTIEESILIASRTPGTVNGASVVVTGYAATVELNAGTVLATGKLNVKIQDSPDNVTWTDWYSFIEITPTNDDQTFKTQYTGDKVYIRAVAVLTLANATYAVNIILNQGYTAEDYKLSSILTAARIYCEEFQHKAYITQVWEMSLPYFYYPDIEIPKGNLQTVDSITYKDSTGVTHTHAPANYIVSTRGIVGRLTPAYGLTFPSFTPYPIDAIIITFTCGYGTAADVPQTVIQAMVIHMQILNGDYTPDKIQSAKDTRDALLWQGMGVINL